MRPAVRLRSLVFFALPVALPFAFAVVASAQTIDTLAFAGLRWREVGPYRGGRSVAVAGSAARPNEYWMGTTGGGVFKTVDGGRVWLPMTDKYFGGTIGAVQVSESNPDIVWAGGGETDIRGNTAPGDGVWKTTDAGKTWTKIDYFDVKNHVNRIRIHPTNPNIVWIGVLGHAFGPNDQRGVFKTTDGGTTWRRVLFRDATTGISDLAVDPNNPNVLYAAFWHAFRTPWSLNSGGAGGGIFKSTDGGETWKEISANTGLPKPPLGKIGLAVSGAKSSRIWALVEADSGGVYRSDNGGDTWTRLNDERKLRQRAWYYSRIYADPKDTNIVYALNVSWFRSKDGGKTFPENMQVPHGDNHDLWIAPNDANRMIESNDGGANVSLDKGATWTDQSFATAQMYHVTATNHFPYKICGAQQDNSTLCGPSKKVGGITIADWMDAGGGESGYIAASPTNPDIVFAGSYGGLLTRKDMRTGLEWNVNPWPDNPMGMSSEDIKYKFQWTFPITFSPHDPNTMYVGGSNLFMTRNGGDSYQIISPPLARNDPKTLGASGGPITKDQTGVETYGVVFAFAESPVLKGVLWAGTDDGLIQLSRDAGKTWKNVTPKDIGDFSRISIIEPSPFAAGAAYVAANRYQQDDFAPIFYKTTDFGATWTRIVNGIGPSDFARAIREDPARKGLLYAGTEHGVYVSFNDGANWQPMRLNMPPVAVHDLMIKEGDLLAATHGRSFYVLDDISVLRQLAPAVAAEPVHLYKPRDTYRVDWGGRGGGGGGRGQPGVAQNPPSGVVVSYQLAKPASELTMEFLDPAGKVIKSFTSRVDSTAGRGGRAGGGDPDVQGPPPPPVVPNKAGLNQFVWDMRYPDATVFPGMILWAGNTRGPIAPAATYTVRLIPAGQQPTTQTFKLLNDPRSPATAADLLAQFNFLIKIRDKVSEANEAVISMRYVKSEIDERLKQAPPQAVAELSSAGKSLGTNLTTVEAEVYQIKNQSSQDPLNFPIKLNNKLAALTGVVSSAPGKPTAQSIEVFDELVGKLGAQTKKMEVIYSLDLRAFNELLKKYKLPEIDTKPKPKIAM
ncbi:MAG TPA: glycosyl hydrolase [Gemmatimonadaceae bacterium]|nr:glycosyl hydrolase [Gemmatimonadaceae bacterium]